MRRYLPLALLVTLLVVVAPAVAVSATVTGSGLLWKAASVALAVALSMALATAGAAVWMRERHSCDIVFADLLIWGWLRRCWTERRLSQARALYDSARKAGPAVSIELLTGLSRLLEARDPYTHGHGQRVARSAGQIARAMHLPDVEIARIRTAAAVHDVGKLYTPREILNNPNRLSDAEFEVAKRHAAWGARMLATVGDREIGAMVRHHHERIDGGGYPDGLAGEEIPVGARIIAVADTFDAITSSRVYRAAGTQRRALEVLSQEAGKQLDGDAVAAFQSTYSARRSVGWLALAMALPQRLLATVQSALPGVGIGAGGVASLLPGVGAAGLLALSPGMHHATPAARTAHGLPAITRPQRASTPAATTPSQRTSKTGSGRSNQGTYRRYRISLPPPTRPSAPTRRTALAPSAAVNGSGGHAGEPEAREAAPTPPPIPPVQPVPVPVVPAPPPPPAPLVPGPPEVKTPPVPLPTIPIPGVTTPSEVPGLSLPRAG
jgi:HD-GYP domain-containing protein (c-di-GMP phosphodiesterase class II)